MTKSEDKRGSEGEQQPTQSKAEQSETERGTRSEALPPPTDDGYPYVCAAELNFCFINRK